MLRRYWKKPLARAMMMILIVMMMMMAKKKARNGLLLTQAMLLKLSEALVPATRKRKRRETLFWSRLQRPLKSK